MCQHDCSSQTALSSNSYSVQFSTRRQSNYGGISQPVPILSLSNTMLVTVLPTFCEMINNKKTTQSLRKGKKSFKHSSVSQSLNLSSHFCVYAFCECSWADCFGKLYLLHFLMQKFINAYKSCMATFNAT